jgi:hypothetical protein
MAKLAVKRLLNFMHGAITQRIWWRIENKLISGIWRRRGDNGAYKRMHMFISKHHAVFLRIVAVAPGSMKASNEIWA